MRKHVGASYQGTSAWVGYLTENDYQVTSRGITSVCDSPLPDLGSDEAVAAALAYWEEYKEKTMKAYHFDKAKVLVEQYLPMLDIHPNLSTYSGVQIPFPNIQRLNNALLTLAKHDLLMEVFDMDDLPVLEYETFLETNPIQAKEPTT